MGIIHHTNSSEDPDESSEDRHCLYGFLLVWQLFSFPVCVIFHHFILICNCRISPSSRAGINSMNEWVLKWMGLETETEKKEVFSVCKSVMYFKAFQFIIWISPHLAAGSLLTRTTLWVGCEFACFRVVIFPLGNSINLELRFFFFFNLSQNSLRQLPGVFKRPNVIFMAVVSL